MNHIPKNFNFYFVKYGALFTIPLILILKFFNWDLGSKITQYSDKLLK